MTTFNPSDNDNLQVQAVVKPVLYTDIFDFPLTFEEIYHYLDCRATRKSVQNWLDQAAAAGYLALHQGYYSLPHRTQLTDTRRQRHNASKTLWPRALCYGAWIASLPFVEMVAVTGSLAVDNPREGTDDIDYLVVTRPRRLWLCRAMIILLVRWGHVRGVHLCPNYLITENALTFDQNLFTAREILQMKPIFGRRVYGRIRQKNGWVAEYFPHGQWLSPEKIDERLSWLQRLVKRTGQLLLSGFIGSGLDYLLGKVQMTKHNRRARQLGHPDRTAFTADVCKGHYDGHGQKTLLVYRQRLSNYLNGHSPNGKSGK